MTRLMARIGRRGTVLLLFSLVYGLFSAKALLDPVPDMHQFYLWAFMPNWVRFVILFVPAVLAAVAAFMPRRSNDALGFSALVVPTIILCGLHALSFVGFLLGYTTYGVAWVDTLEWAVILLLLLIISGWAEVKPTPKKDQ